MLGQHGSPAHGVFDLDAYLACVDDGAPFENIELTEEDSFAAPQGVPKGDYYMGCDLGYARDPSEFVVYRVDGPDLVNVLRVHLAGVNYAKQQDVIAELDRAYAFCRIGIDSGNSGRAVAHNLLHEGGAWPEKITAIEFGGTLSLAPHEDGTEHRRPTKAYMTELLERRIAERTIIFPRLPEREAQYASHTYTVGQHGRIIYDKGNDHLIDADRCALLAHYFDTQEVDIVHLGAPIDSFGQQ